jgi:signal transduction histidine kinase
MLCRYEEISQFNRNSYRQKLILPHPRELQKSNEKLKALDSAKDEFISMASHQLRTPLTSVKGYISMILEGDAGEINDLQKKFLNQAFISSQRMVYLISDLLNVSRLKTGKFVIENRETYLPDTVEDELRQLDETIKARGLSIDYKKPKKFPTVMLDEDKVRQVIMNFADNAIYYTPSGGKIYIELKATDEVVKYTVKDTGIGVPKHEQHHLFTKFYRAGNARKARPDGTGLGLFMAKKVITAQGGSIIFSSEQGKGSTFGFSLPRKKVEKTT